VASTASEAAPLTMNKQVAHSVTGEKGEIRVVSDPEIGPSRTGIGIGNGIGIGIGIEMRFGES
jgi:hypothetical protein